MKRKSIFIFAAIIIAVAFVFIKPVILSVAKSKLKTTFPKSIVTIKDLHFKPMGSLAFSNVCISKENIYNFKISEFEINCNPVSLIKLSIPKITVKNALFEINIPNEQLQHFSQYISFKKSSNALSIKHIEISDLKIKVNSSDINIDADISIPGDLYISKLTCDKFIIRDLKSRASFADNSLSLQDITAQFWGGSLSGIIDINIGKKLSYNIDLKALDLDLQQFIDDFKLNDKLQAQGFIQGEIFASGKGLVFDRISGDFSATAQGGTLTIIDEKLLETIAGRTQQPLELIKQSFKEYHYNTGAISLGTEDNDLKLSIFMDGEKGKRDIQIILHDFK